MLEPDALHAASPLGSFPLGFARLCRGNLRGGSISHRGGQRQAATAGGVNLTFVTLASQVTEMCNPKGYGLRAGALARRQHQPLLASLFLGAPLAGFAAFGLAGLGPVSVLFAAA